MPTTILALQKTPESGAARVPRTAMLAKRTSATMPISTKASRLQTLVSGLSAARAARRRIISAAWPAVTTTIQARNIQPIGDWLKAWRLLKTPLRVRKVAKLHKREGRDRQGEGGLLQGAAASPGHQSMDQGGAGQPGDQRSVFDGVPTPVAAPAQFFIGPRGAPEDAAAEHRPRRKWPKAAPGRPGVVRAVRSRGRRRPRQRARPRRRSRGR